MGFRALGFGSTTFLKLEGYKREILEALRKL